MRLGSRGVNQVTIETIRTCFDKFLSANWHLDNVDPFTRTFIRLLLLFVNELKIHEQDALLQRQRQSRGDSLDGRRFSELLQCAQEELVRGVHDADNKRRAALNRLLFCALMDTAESDFFYFTEPMFECVEALGVLPSQLLAILESEFPGFMV